MDECGMAWRGSKFYSHMLPSLESPGWKNNRVAGEGWMAVGDAGGLVDPITGEGLYYAIRSGDLASRVMLDDAHGILEKAAAYRATLAPRFAGIWNSLPRSRGACFWARLCLTPSRADGPVYAAQSAIPRVDAGFVRGHATLRRLRGPLLRNLNGTLREVLMNLC